MSGRPALLFLAAASCLPSAALEAQQSSPSQPPAADMRPSLAAPPQSPPAGSRAYDDRSFQTGSESYQPLQAVPPAGQAPSYQGGAIGNPPLGPCTCQGVPAGAYRPVTTYSPAALPPAAYSTTYVPPPPVPPFGSQRVVYQSPVVYGQAVPAPVIYYRPAAPVAAAPSNYYLPPIVPVRNVPAGTTIGRGIVGQPTVYVPGQPVRNFLRYLSP